MIYVILTFNKDGEEKITESEKLPIGNLSIKEANQLQANVIKMYREKGFNYPTMKFVKE